MKSENGGYGHSYGGGGPGGYGGGPPQAPQPPSQPDVNKIMEQIANLQKTVMALQQGSGGGGAAAPQAHSQGSGGGGGYNSGYNSVMGSDGPPAAMGWPAGKKYPRQRIIAARCSNLLILIFVTYRMAMFFWYPVQSNFSIRNCTIAFTGQVTFTRYQKTRPCLSVYPAQYTYKIS